jgi:predicted nucleic acid-binding protein
MKVLLDTNVVLDALLGREPFRIDADAIMEAIKDNRIEGHLTATTLTDIFYIARKQTGAAVAKQYVSDILATMQVCTVNVDILQAAVASELSDLEDAVQLACALAYNVDAIVTRNFAGFVDSPVPIKSPGELLGELS